MTVRSTNLDQNSGRSEEDGRRFGSRHESKPLIQRETKCLSLDKGRTRIGMRLRWMDEREMPTCTGRHCPSHIVYFMTPTLIYSYVTRYSLLRPRQRLDEAWIIVVDSIQSEPTHSRLCVPFQASRENSSPTSSLSTKHCSTAAPYAPSERYLGSINILGVQGVFQGP